MRKVLDAEAGEGPTLCGQGLSRRQAHEVGRDQMQGLSPKGGDTGLRVVSGGEEPYMSSRASSVTLQ